QGRFGDEARACFVNDQASVVGRRRGRQRIGPFDRRLVAGRENGERNEQERLSDGVHRRRIVAWIILSYHERAAISPANSERLSAQLSAISEEDIEYGSPHRLP